MYNCACTVHVCTCMYMYVHVCSCMYNVHVHVHPVGLVCDEKCDDQNLYNKSDRQLCAMSSTVTSLTRFTVSQGHAYQLVAPIIHTHFIDICQHQAATSQYKCPTVAIGLKGGWRKCRDELTASWQTRDLVFYVCREIALNRKM